MGEKKAVPTLQYRNPDLPAWPPRRRSPLGLVVSYAVGCGGGFWGGLILAVKFKTYPVVRGSITRDSIAGITLCFGFVTFTVSWVMIVMTLLAVSIRTYLIGPRPVVMVRPLYSFLSGFVVGLGAGAGLFLMGNSERQGPMFVYLTWIMLPVLAAMGGAIGLVRPVTASQVPPRHAAPSGDAKDKFPPTGV